MNPELLADVAAIAPEMWLTGAILIALLADLVLGRRLPALAGLVAISGCLVALWHLPGPRALCADLVGLVGVSPEAVGTPAEHAFRVFGLLALDAHADFFRTLVISAVALVCLHALVFRGLEEGPRAEFFPVMLCAALGGCLLVSTDHMLMLLLAMEMLSLPSYLLAGWQKTERRSSEAALKYLVYGALASGLMVFGFSLIYGLSGSLWLGDAGAALVSAWEFGDVTQQAAVAFASVLVFAGLAFKISAFPFHFWAPDVYEGAPTPVTTMLAVASKAAGFGLLLRFVDVVFMGDVAVSGDWLARFSWIFGVLAAVTMTYGNVTAVLQRNVKRLLAYSSISHAGFLLVGVAVMTRDPGMAWRGTGMHALLFYLVTYYVATIGAFACAMSLANRFGAEDTDDYRGLGWSAPWTGAAFVFFLVSLVGLPPTAGFIGKLLLFRATLDAGLYWLAVVGALNAAVALFYYFKIGRALFLRGETKVVPSLDARGLLPSLATMSIAALALATLWLGLSFDGLVAWVSASLL